MELYNKGKDFINLFKLLNKTFVLEVGHDLVKLNEDIAVLKELKKQDLLQIANKIIEFVEKE